MLLGRTFAHADAHRARLGVNYKQIPVNAPKTRCTRTPRTTPCGSATPPTRCMRQFLRRAPGHPARAAQVHWVADGEMVRAAYTLRANDDDWGQASVLVPDVMDDDERQRLVSNVAGHLRNGVSDEVLHRAFQYWRNVDKEVGDNIEQAVRNGLS
jgi:catalase